MCYLLEQVCFILLQYSTLQYSAVKFIAPCNILFHLTLLHNTLSLFLVTQLCDLPFAKKSCPNNHLEVITFKACICF